MLRHLLLLAIFCRSEAFSSAHIPRLEAAKAQRINHFCSFHVRDSPALGTAVLDGLRKVTLLKADRITHSRYCNRHGVGLGSTFAQWMCTDQSLFGDFVETYSGEFHNKIQRTADPSVQYSRKLHKRIDLPSLGAHTFFVNEETDTGGGMQFRLRVASLSEGPEEGSFQAKNFAFRSEELEKKLQSEDAWHLLDSLSPEQDLELVKGGTVVFRKLEGGQVYEAKVEYEKCSAAAAQPVRTEIESLLSPSNWLVRATFRDDTGAVVRFTEIDMDRIVD